MSVEISTSRYNLARKILAAHLFNFKSKCEDAYFQGQLGGFLDAMQLAGCITDVEHSMFHDYRTYVRDQQLKGLRVCDADKKCIAAVQAFVESCPPLQGESVKIAEDKCVVCGKDLTEEHRTSLAKVEPPFDKRCRQCVTGNLGVKGFPRRVRYYLLALDQILRLQDSKKLPDEICVGGGPIYYQTGTINGAIAVCRRDDIAVPLLLEELARRKLVFWFVYEDLRVSREQPKALERIAWHVAPYTDIAAAGMGLEE